MRATALQRYALMMPEDHATAQNKTSTVDETEVQRFNALAAKWWDPAGEFRPLHNIGPARLTFIRDTIIAELALPASQGLQVLRGVRVLDIGCGGGLVAEPLARLGATVTGIDPAADSIAAAKAHAATQGLSIDYRAQRAEDVRDAGQTFDAVLCLEVVEHVPDVAAFVALVASLVRPGGVLILSTLNRTLKAYALAIIGAEYVLRWVPAGTHQWSKFVKPDELAAAVQKAGLSARPPRGMVFHPLDDRWSLSDDTDVNYLMAARQP